MNDTEAGKELLENAYQLSTPEDNVAYYEKLASTYDTDFAAGLGYALPKLVANLFSSLATADDTPIVDVGCGTGLLAQALSNPSLTIDGFDISNAMLEKAGAKNLYRKLYQVDLTEPLNSKGEQYGAVLSIGTFTHGHLGPEALVNLLSIAAQHALFIVSINKAHYAELKFDDALARLVSSNKIENLQALEVEIYSDQGHAHSHDKGLLVTFRAC